MKMISAFTFGLGTILLFFSPGQSFAPTLPPPTSLTLSIQSTGSVTNVILQGSPFASYVIETTSQLSADAEISWIAIATNVQDSAGYSILVETNASLYPQRFYRAYSTH